MNRVTFIYAVHVGHSTLADHGWRPDHPRGPDIDVCRVDGACSRISFSTSLEAHRRCFLAFMVDAPTSPALTPPRGPAVNVS
jgi:hypothetical protein